MIEGDSSAQRGSGRRVPVEVRSRRTLNAQHATRKGERQGRGQACYQARAVIEVWTRDQRRGIGVDVACQSMLGASVCALPGRSGRCLSLCETRFSCSAEQRCIRHACAIASQEQARFQGRPVSAC